jgi:hypothetical protein
MGQAVATELLVDSLMAFYLPGTPQMLLSAPLVLSLAVCVFPLVSVAALGIEGIAASHWQGDRRTL